MPPPKSSAIPKFRQMDLACPICRYPFGSGGNRVATRPPYVSFRTSFSTISRIKCEPDSGASSEEGRAAGFPVSIMRATGDTVGFLTPISERFQTPPNPKSPSCVHSALQALHFA